MDWRFPHIGFYILEGHEPVECDDILEWGEWMGTANRHVGHIRRGDIEVSTVFLGLDQNFCFDGASAPVLFETMIFGGPLDHQMERYSTWDEAESGHRRWLALAFPPVEYVH